VWVRVGLQAGVNAGRLSEVGRPVLDEEELHELELPPPLDADDEATGVPGAEDVALAEIGDGPEDIGLDAEVGMTDGFEPGVEPLEEQASVLEDEPAGELIAEVDAEGDEGGWLEESEGSAEPWSDGELDDDDEDYAGDDGGLEGVDDPLADGLDDEDGESHLGDDDGTLGDELQDELLREIAGEGTAAERG
jgi:hypothetical protein